MEEASIQGDQEASAIDASCGIRGVGRRDAANPVRCDRGERVKEKQMDRC